LKALAKRPEERYPSAAELAEDLQNVVADKPISASPRRRHRRFALGLSLLGVLLALMAAQQKWFSSASTGNQSTYRPSLVNDFGMTFVRILPQRYAMGSPLDEPKRQFDELLHYVSITNTIYMQTTDVTQGEYAAVMGDNQSRRFATSEKLLPVVNVSWDDANAFCRELEKKDPGRHYRLPTEAEWELACRAGKVGEFADGKPLQEIGWFLGNSEGHLHPVAGKQPNSWGLYDMQGDAAQWCADYYGTYHFEVGQTSTDPTGPDSGKVRVIRGGSFAQPEEMCRCAARGGILPTDKRPEVGFRVVMQPR
jgi:formylglycine-generating enzyme required for sulfatase activity